ncbi:MAG: hypothetical protein ABEJ79_00085 [Halolamina sp.]
MQPSAPSASLFVSLRFVVGLVAAAVAVLAMDAVMARLPEGETSPRIAAGVLTHSPPGDAPDRLASVVHYLAGGLTGPLFVWLLFAVEGVVGGRSLLATGVATVVLYALMVGFFAVVVLPRSRVADGRAGPIRRDWALAAAGYVAVLVPLVAVGTGVL